MKMGGAVKRAWLKEGEVKEGRTTYWTKGLCLNGDDHDEEKIVGRRRRRRRRRR